MRLFYKEPARKKKKKKRDILEFEVARNSIYYHSVLTVSHTLRVYIEISTPGEAYNCDMLQIGSVG